MPRRDVMAPLAQPRPRFSQHARVHGAVGVVTVQAALDHRRMLEQERPALLRMALEASFVDGRLLQQRLRIAAVRVMAVRAYDLAFTHRHMFRARHPCLNVLVALEAGVGLELGLQLSLARHVLHDRVAIGAHEAARFVRAAVPQCAVALLMAGKANAVVLFGGARIIVRTERVDAADATSAAGLHMGRARTQ